jgi:hypothetical protein
MNLLQLARKKFIVYLHYIADLPLPSYTQAVENKQIRIPQ